MLNVHCTLIKSFKLSMALSNIQIDLHMLYIKYIKVQKSHLSCKFNKLKENKYILSLALNRAVARISAVGGKGAIEYIFLIFKKILTKL